jgi:hypothetical protein
MKRYWEGEGYGPLTPSELTQLKAAWKFFQETQIPAAKLYEETRAPAWKLFEETVAPARRLYEETADPASKPKTYYDTTDPAWKPYEKVEAAAQKLFEETIAPEWRLYGETVAPAQKLLKETEARIMARPMGFVAMTNALLAGTGKCAVPLPEEKDGHGLIAIIKRKPAPPASRSSLGGRTMPRMKARETTL